VVTPSVDIVLVAIRSGIKLGQQMRQAYVDSTKNRELVLPLPNFFGSVDMTSARTFFVGDGIAYVEGTPRLAALLQKYHPTADTLTMAETSEILTFYREFFYLHVLKAGSPVSGIANILDLDQFTALLTIRQWNRGDEEGATVLHRLAGTFVDIGIDYFMNVPGALNKDSREGKAIAGFLQGMSEVPFSEAQLGTLPGRLFVAAIETMSENAALLTGEPAVQELLSVATKGLSIDVSKRLEQLNSSGGDLVKQEKIVDWAELVFRSLLSSAGTTVLGNPTRYLSVNEGQSALISEVSSALLGLAVDELGIHLDGVLGRPGLEKIMKSALAAIGEHPEIVASSSNQGLQVLLSAIARELGGYGTFFSSDMLPELTRLIMEKTGENLPLLWPDIANDPACHLLLGAASTALDVLGHKPKEDGPWRMRFTGNGILSITKTVFDELIGNPTWLIDEAGNINGNLRTALEVAVDVLRRRADSRLNAETAANIVRTVLTTASMRKELLERIAITDLGERTVLEALLDKILQTLFSKNLDQKAAWQLVRADTISAIVRICLTCLAKGCLDPQRIAIFGDFVTGQVNKLAEGRAFDVQLFADDLQQVLNTP
jgi:hypothetical protein